jgi:hypothetical protein
VTPFAALVVRVAALGFVRNAGAAAVGLVEAQVGTWRTVLLIVGTSDGRAVRWLADVATAIVGIAFEAGAFGAIGDHRYWAEHLVAVVDRHAHRAALAGGNNRGEAVVAVGFCAVDGGAVDAAVVLRDASVGIVTNATAANACVAGYWKELTVVRTRWLAAREDHWPIDVRAHDAIWLGRCHDRASDRRLIAALVGRGTAVVEAALAGSTGGGVDLDLDDGAVVRVGDVEAVSRFVAVLQVAVWHLAEA